MIYVPLRTSTGPNTREHYTARARRVRHERDAIAWALQGHSRPPASCSVRLTRIAPSAGLDDDNLVVALKAVRDQVATWLGVDDRHRDRVRYVYAQHRGPWGVAIEWGQPAAEPPPFEPLQAA